MQVVVSNRVACRGVFFLGIAKWDAIENGRPRESEDLSVAMPAAAGVAFGFDDLPLRFDPVRRFQGMPHTASHPSRPMNTLETIRTAWLHEMERTRGAA